MGKFINKSFNYRLNDDIVNYDKVRLIYKEHSSEEGPNDFNKVVSLSDAKKISEKMSLDLIEINNKTTPPLIRLCDYSKFLWEQKKKEKTKNRNSISMKEIQLKANIADNDLETKAKAALKFLNSGHKVKVVLTLKGREMSRKEYSKESFYKFLSIVGEDVLFEMKPITTDSNNVATIIKTTIPIASVGPANNGKI